MKLFFKAFLLTFSAGLFQTILPLKATPWVYSTGGRLYSSTSECVSEARRFARASGFTVTEVLYDDNPINGAGVFAINSFREARLNFRCETAYEVYSYAIASKSNETAYELYVNSIDNDPGQI